jgi:hypothetical protein
MYYVLCIYKERGWGFGWVKFGFLALVKVAGSLDGALAGGSWVLALVKV